MSKALTDCLPACSKTEKPWRASCLLVVVAALAVSSVPALAAPLPIASSAPALAAPPPTASPALSRGECDATPFEATSLH